MAKGKWFKKIEIGIAFSLAVSIVAPVSIPIGQINVKAATDISNPRIADDGTVTWDKVTFGSYPQDATFEKEPIKWRILQVNEDGTDAFLMADKGLDCKPYNDQHKDVSWETCSLRKWLNDIENENSFINKAFTDDEQKIIKDTAVINNDNPEYNIMGGNDTTDKVYLLSMDEASDVTYGFDSAFNISSGTREAKATDYAKLNGGYRSNETGQIGNCYWWLRSPGSRSDNAVYVVKDCWGESNGGFVNETFQVVRPVLHINLNSVFVSDAGKVCSDGSIVNVTDVGYTDDGYINPVITKDNSTWDCVYFGSYEQTATFVKKPIEWRVLSVNGDDALVLADKALDCKPFNETLIDVTWETSTIRSWLNNTTNRDSFINNAFSSDEQKIIKEITNVNRDNRGDNYEGCIDTKDKVFLLSVDECTNSMYGFDETFEWGSEVKNREASPTDYSLVNGVHSYSSSEGTYWWLRSPGFDSKAASYISCAGEGGDNLSVNVSFDAVRPALHVSLNDKYIKKSGTISSESNITDESIENQQKANEVINSISEIENVTKDSKAKIEVARKAYEALTDNNKLRIFNYNDLLSAEKELKAIEKGNKEENKDNKNTTNGNKNNDTNNQNKQESEEKIEVPSDNKVADNNKVIASNDKSIDNATTFNIANKKTYKKSKKVTIKDTDGIKSITLNSKKIKIKSGKRSISFKLSKYKKYLKKKNKWNKLIVVDVNENKKVIQFKVK